MLPKLQYHFKSINGELTLLRGAVQTIPGEIY